MSLFAYLSLKYFLTPRQRACHQCIYSFYLVKNMLLVCHTEHRGVLNYSACMTWLRAGSTTWREKSLTHLVHTRIPLSNIATSAEKKYHRRMIIWYWYAVTMCTNFSGFHSRLINNTGNFLNTIIIHSHPQKVKLEIRIIRHESKNVKTLTLFRIIWRGRDKMQYVQWQDIFSSLTKSFSFSFSFTIW